MKSHRRKDISIVDNVNLLLNADQDEFANTVNPPNDQRRCTIADILGNFFVNNKARILFNWTENIYPTIVCPEKSNTLTWFKTIHLIFSPLRVKAKGKDYELSPQQFF